MVTQTMTADTGLQFILQTEGSELHNDVLETWD